MSDLQRADAFLHDKDYASALDIYLTENRKNSEDPLLKYKIGICYFNSSNHKRKAIGYFEYAKNYKNDSVPVEVYYYLGRCYHFSYRFIEAVNMLNIYQDELEKNDAEGEFQDYLEVIKMCDNGARFLKDPVNSVSVQTLDYPINTSYDDYSPLVSNDGRMLIFSSSRPQNSVHLVHGDEYTFLPSNLQSTSEDIHVSTRKGIDWRFPDPQNIMGKKIETLSISSDNSMLLLSILEEGQSKAEIYISNRKRGKWATPKKLGGKINSKYNEKGACFSESGRVIYLSSDRPGGYGGFDIYRLTKTGKYEWGNPENLGPTINSSQDEINPFVHPDTRNLYFSSNGHDTMGGLDIFSSKKDEENRWLKPQNLGYPINSTFDDDCFTQVPNGQYAYISSNRIEDASFGQKDIISIFKPQKKLPLTMMKGIIRVTENNQYQPITLKVIDSETNKEQPYVYNPDKETGNYFIILKPDRHYSISVQVNGNELQRIEVDIPEKTYNYELNRSFIIEPFKLFGQTIGSAVKLDSARSSHEITKLSQIEAAKTGTEYRYDAMILLMEQLIATVDFEGWEKINDLEDTETYLDTKDFGSHQSDYYDKLFERVKNAFDIANAEILATLQEPQMMGAKMVFFGQSDGTGREILSNTRLSFATGASRLGRNHIQNLQELADFLLKIPNVDVEFTAKAKNIEQVQANYNKITENIQTVLRDKGVDFSQITFKQLLESDKTASSGNNLIIDVIVYKSSSY